MPPLPSTQNPPKNTLSPHSLTTNSKILKPKMRRPRNHPFRILESTTTVPPYYFSMNLSTPCNLSSTRFTNLQQGSSQEDNPPSHPTAPRTNRAPKTWVSGQLRVVCKRRTSPTNSPNSKDAPVLITTHFFDIYNLYFLIYERPTCNWAKKQHKHFYLEFETKHRFIVIVTDINSNIIVLEIEHERSSTYRNLPRPEG